MNRPSLWLAALLPLLAFAVSCDDSNSTGPDTSDVPTAAQYVILSEVESNGGTPGDWVELCNSHAEALSLVNYILRDNDDSHTYTFSAGTTIPGNGYLVVEEAALGFGLGAPDNVRLFRPDGVSIVDSYSWTAHATTTAARCALTSGAAFSDSSIPTKGEANDCLPLVRINEIETDGGTPGDWVEIYNPNAAAFAFGGYFIRDNGGSYTVPAGTSIPADGRLVIERAQLGFELDAADSLKIVRPNGTGVVDAYGWTAHAATTYGRCPDATGAIIETTSPTKNAANNCVVPTTTVVINEVESNGGTPGDWVELYNAGTTTADLSGFLFGDNSAARYTIPAGTTIPAGGYLVLNEIISGVGEFTFGLGAADAARLWAADGTTLADSVSWTAHAAVTYGRCPNGTGPLTDNATSTKGAANACVAFTSPVIINEVESNGGTPGDWVELYNTGASAVDLGGYIFKDGDDSHAYVIPAGTMISAGGYYVLDEVVGGVGHFNFGLGTPDMVRLFGPDGLSIVDSLSWTPHSPTTLGRCPNVTGIFVVTGSATKGAANDCGHPIKINEVESNMDAIGDWAELYNTADTAVNIGGYVFRDNDDSDPDHAYAIPAGTIIAAKGFYVLDEAALNYGLGGADAAQLYRPGGTTLIDSYSWTDHSPSTYGRCPDGFGAFRNTASPTKGAANNCAEIALSVKVNEVESDGGTPGDWVELYNGGATTADLSSYVFGDSDAANRYVLPAGTTLAPGAFLVLDQATFGFGLGGNDAVYLFHTDGATMIDSYAWTAHASVTWVRCPDGTGGFQNAVISTKGAANACPGMVIWQQWPGESTITTVDPGSNFFAGNMSGLAYTASGTSALGTLWAARNGPGSIFKLTWNGSIWTPYTNDGWSNGKLLFYTDGTGEPDSEGIAVVGTSAYIASERNNAASGVSRNSILRFDLTATGTTITAAMEWNVTSVIPATGANLGLEAVTFVPDAYLVARGFKTSASTAYNPADHANHEGGLFFVAVEETGAIHAFALDHVAGTATLVASVQTPFAGVMDLFWDREREHLWVLCDNGCNGRTVVMEVETAAGDTQGRWVATHGFERPTGMPNLNNEGFAVAAQAECVGGLKPAWWTDDGQTGGFSIRAGTVTCAALPAPTGSVPAIRGR